MRESLLTRRSALSKAEVRHELLADDRGGNSAQIYSGVGNRCSDPTSQSSRVVPFDLQRCDVLGRRHEPSDCAAFRTAAPFTGVRNTTPVPDFAGSRRAMTQSRFAPAFPSAPRTFARPPGWSSILELQISTFVTVKLIRGCSPLSVTLEGDPLLGQANSKPQPDLRGAKPKFCFWAGPEVLFQIRSSLACFATVRPSIWLSHP